MSRKLIFSMKENRHMRRAEKEITGRKELEAILTKATICRIGFIDQNVPYIVPLNFGYKNGCLYFHSASEGKKIDLMKKNNFVCFEVDVDHDIVDTGIPCNWSSKYASIIGYGTVSFITNEGKKKEALNCIIDHYSPGTSYDFPKKNLDEVTVIQVKITQMAGKKS